MYIGNNEINAVYLGSEEITKIYQGNTVIYEKGGEPEPPLDPTVPLTFEITGNGNIVWKASSTAYTVTIEYKLNNDEWTSITGTTEGVTIPVVAGDTIQFRGDNTAYCDETHNYNSFSGSTAQFKVKGNIMSLIDSTNFGGLTTLESAYTFYHLFDGCTGLTDASELILPATTLADRCYFYMFRGCTSLTTAPSSIGTTATTMTTSACTDMFDGCTSLTTAPELPATTLASGCYRNMFKNCTNLNYIKCLATDISATLCTSNWVNGVSGTGTFVTPSSTVWTTGSGGIPTNWTRVDA